MKLAQRMGLALFFETLENLPLFLGGVLAVWWSRQGLVGYALGAAILGCGLGALAIHYGEPYESPDFESTWRKTLFNFIAFMVCTAVISVYFCLVRQAGWWDVIVGLLLGLLLTALESPSFTNWRSWWSHAVSMMVATGTGVVVVRGLVSQDALGKVVTGTLGLTVILSVLITGIEYWPQWYRAHAKSKS